MHCTVRQWALDRLWTGRKRQRAREQGNWPGYCWLHTLYPAAPGSAIASGRSFWNFQLAAPAGSKRCDSRWSRWELPSSFESMHVHEHRKEKQTEIERSRLETTSQPETERSRQRQTDKTDIVSTRWDQSALCQKVPASSPGFFANVILIGFRSLERTKWHIFTVPCQTKAWLPNCEV